MKGLVVAIVGTILLGIVLAASLGADIAQSLDRILP